MLHPQNGERRWRFQELSDYMNAHKHRHPNASEESIAFMPDAWVPYPTFLNTDPRHREIRFLDTRRLGEGSFGIVFAVAVALPLSLEDNGERRYAPAAMKVATRGSDHFDEVISALTLNDAVLAGITPNINRLIDAFAVSPSVKAVQGPPLSWTGFWSQFGDFIYERRSDMRGAYGRHFEVTRDEATKRVTLPSNLTLCVSFFELAPNFLDARIAAAYEPSRLLRHSASVGLDPPSPLSRSDSVVAPKIQRSDRQRRRRAALGYSWQALQGMEGIHALGMLHCDPHGNNLVNHGDGHMRTSVCLLGTLATDVSVRKCFGESSKNDRPSDNLQTGARRYYRVPLSYGRDTGDDLLRVVALDVDIPQVAWIDFGSTTRLEIHPHMSASTIRNKCTDTKNIPDNIISSKPLRYDYDASWLGGDASGLPGMIRLHGPVTVIYSRPPELLNPRVSTIDQKVMYSELSDTFAVMVSIIEHILGFHIFGKRIRVVVGSNFNEHSLGIRVLKGNDRYDCNFDGVDVRVDATVKLEDENETARRSARSRGHHTSTNRAPDDCWGTISSPLYAQLWKEIAPELLREDDRTRLLQHWLGSDDDTFKTAAESLIHRIIAIGSPPKYTLVGTLLGPIIENAKLEFPQHNGWLRTTLMRALSSHYGVERTRAMDFVNLAMHALSWDPADRPPISELLRCSIFEEFYVDMRDEPNYVTPQHVWSATSPTLLTCKRRPNGGLYLPETEKCPFREHPRHGHPVSYSKLALEAARPVSRIKRIRRECYAHVAINGQCADQYAPIHPGRSNMLRLFSLESGLLDAFDGMQLLPCHIDPSDDRRVCMYEIWQMPKISLKYRSNHLLQRHCATLITHTHKNPSWLFRKRERVTKARALPVASRLRTRKRTLSISYASEKEPDELEEGEVIRTPSHSAVPLRESRIHIPLRPATSQQKRRKLIRH